MRGEGGREGGRTNAPEEKVGDDEGIGGHADGCCGVLEEDTDPSVKQAPFT